MFIPTSSDRIINQNNQIRVKYIVYNISDRIKDHKQNGKEYIERIQVV